MVEIVNGEVFIGGSSSETPNENLPESYKENKAAKTSLVTDISEDEHYLESDLGSAQAKKAASVKVKETSNKAISNAIGMTDTQIEEIELLVNYATRDQAILAQSTVPETDYHILGEHDEDSVFKKVNKLGQHRMAVINDRFERKLGERSEGILPLVGYFLDSIINVPVDVLSGGGFTREAMAEELRSLVTDVTLSEKDFIQRVDEIIDRAGDLSLLTDTNPFYLWDLQDIHETGDAGPSKAFTVLDGALGVSSIYKNLTKAADVLGTAKATVGRQKMVDTVIKEAAKGTNPAVAKHTAPMAVTPGADPIQLVSPSNTALQQIEQSNEALDVLRKHDFGFILQEDDVARALPKVNKAVEEANKGNKRFIDYHVAIDDKFGLAVTRSTFGNAKGGMFPKNAKWRAEKLAEEMGEGQVVPVVEGGKEGWVVLVERNINTYDMVDAIKPNEIATHLWQSFSSSMLTTSKRLDSILKRGEGQLGVVEKDIAAEYRKAKKGVSKKDFDIIDKIFFDYRDGAKSARTKPLTEAEFSDDYYKMTNKRPDAKVLAAFNKINELNDATYFLEANKRFRMAVENNESIVYVPGSETPHRVVNVDIANVPGQRFVYDVDTSNVTSIGATKKGTPVFGVYGGYVTDKGRYRYITGSNLRKRRLFHDDVLPYNVGGPRIYQNPRFFLKQDNELRFADTPNEVVKGAPRTFMALNTQDEAIKAAKEVKALFAELKEYSIALTNPSTQTQRDTLRSLKNDAGAQAIIDKYPNWNTNIENTEDLAEFLDDFDLDLTEDIGFATDTDKIRKFDGTDWVYESGVSNQENYREAFLKASNSRSRRERPLIGYGGGHAATYTPIESIERSFARAVNGKAEEAYVFNAVQAWLKGAKGHINNAPDLVGMRPYDQLVNAKLSDGKFANALRQEQAVIRRRVENHDWFTRKWESTMQSLGDYVYDAGAKKMGVALSSKYSSDPTKALRAIAFDLALGLFAFPQLIVQSSHLIPIMAISKHGFNGMLSVAPIRIALANGTPQMTKYLGNKVSGLLGLTPQQFEELVTFFKVSGRDVIENTVIEQSEDFTLGLGMVHKVRKAGRVFFHEGEKIPRISAMTAAYKEFLEKFPNVSPMSQKGISWITQRQDVLTASMTRSSAAYWQKNSLLSVPLQFMSYSARMMEQIFTGRVLNKEERLRLALAQVSMWGLTGAGMGTVIDYMVNEGVIEPNRSLFTLIKYGIPDWAFGVTTGARTAFSERLSVGEGFYDMFSKLSEDSIVEVLGGPSVHMATSVTETLIRAAGDALHGRVDALKYDVVKLLRNASSGNTLYNSWFLAKTGEYYSRNANTFVANGMGVPEAVFNFLGSPLQDVTLSYSMADSKNNQRQRLLEHGKRIQEMWNLVGQKIKDGDTDGALSIMEDIAMSKAILSPWELSQIKKFDKPAFLSFFETMLNDGIVNSELAHSGMARLLAEDRQRGQE